MKRSIMIALAAALILTGCGETETEDAAPRAAANAPSADAPAAESSESAAETSVTTARTAAETAAETASVTERTAVSTTLPDFLTAPVTRMQNGSAEVLTDIRLWSDKRELTPGRDSPEIIWYAELPVKSSPETVLLIDADTEQIAAVLNDIADYEKYGGDIMGDGVYNCRFIVDTDIDIDPDVSEHKTYRYYAEFADDDGIHRSEPAEVDVYEQFTDKELGDMEAVRNATHELMSDKSFKKLDLAEKCDKMVQLLEKLAAEGTPERPYPLVIAESIHSNGEMISYSHICGIPHTIMLKPLDMNRK